MSYPSAKTTIIALFLLITGISISALGVLHIYAQKRMAPHTKIDGIDVSWMTLDEATTHIRKTSPRAIPQEVILSVEDIKTATSAAELMIQPEYDTAIQLAFQKGKNENPFVALPQLLSTLFNKTQNTVTTPVSIDTQKLAAFVQEFSQKINTQDLEPKVTLGNSANPASLQLFSGGEGRKVVQDATVELATQNITNPQLSSPVVEVTAAVASISAQLSPEEQTQALERATQLVGKEIVLKEQDITIIIPDTQLVEFLAFPAGYDEDAIQSYALQVTQAVNRDPVNAVFEIDSATNKVSQFQPHRDGLTLDYDQFLKTLESHIDQLQQPTDKDQAQTKSMSFTIPTQKKAPALTLDQTNTLGIKEMIGFGESRYDHSIPSRVHNVGLSSERINNTLVAPGEEFSFNKALGEVSGRTGFQPAYVISGGKTQLGDGGGVCQVSSTLFRALLDSGLNITKRRPHSYRVTYYELNSDPGFDATVYSGEVDLRFINDTQHHVLIRSLADTQQRYMKVEIYGTSDGRTTEIVDYKKWGYSPPLPTQFIPTTELPTGRTKQIDWAVSGLKTSFTHIVRDKNGTIIKQDTYQSNYQPWAAKYLRGI